ncbi:hypothetical protein [Actinoalloteichus caeruleus]|uniref:hypothetical protein n=1 Tax=Actinoalloteichus cyanogriseus TaxID=2893586 RepID=UPI003AAAB676
MGTAPPNSAADLWDQNVIEQVVVSFTRPGHRVLLLDTTSNSQTDGTAPELEQPDSVRAGTGETIAALGRGSVVLPATQQTDEGASATPYWAVLIPGNEVNDSAPATARPTPGGPDSPADLVIAVVPPSWTGQRVLDHLALRVAELLRTGGILAVITHCDRKQGRLVDPTGSVVAAAQNADLLYLQHIVAVHSHPADVANTDAEHSDGVIFGPHVLTHSDVLVFAQPHDHHTPPHAPTHGRYALDSSDD